jgi:hypothetical protein
MPHIPRSHGRRALACPATSCLSRETRTRTTRTPGAIVRLSAAQTRVNVSAVFGGSACAMTKTIQNDGRGRGRVQFMLFFVSELNAITSSTPLHRAPPSRYSQRCFSLPPPPPISFQNMTLTNASLTKQSKPPPPPATAPLTPPTPPPDASDALPSSRYFDRQEDELARGSRLLPHHSHKVSARVDMQALRGLGFRVHATTRVHHSVTRDRTTQRTRTCCLSSARVARRRRPALPPPPPTCPPPSRKLQTSASPPLPTTAWHPSDADK